MFSGARGRAGLGIEAGALVGDADDQDRALVSKDAVMLLLRVVGVAVKDCVDGGFAHGHGDAARSSS